MRILLVNSNRMQPPIAPIGLDYLAATLAAAGHEPVLLDLCFEPDPPAAIAQALAGPEFGLVGVTFRNTDDCFYPGRQWFVPELAELVGQIKRHTRAPVMLGGVGFSIMPEAILAQVEADLGVAGEGEFALARWANGDPGPPGSIRRTPAGLVRVPAQPGDLAALPSMPRDLVDNLRYYQQGGQIGFETKRGCAAACIYCADPVAKGRSVRVRPAAAVADEVAALADRGILHLHTCDAEFNRPLEHALAVCSALSVRGLGDQVRWYAYCTPAPFPDDLALAMRRAGCVGINFGADSGDDGMLRRLGRDYRGQEVLEAARRCRRHGIACMLDTLLGGPGETAQSVQASLECLRRCEADRIGLSVGVRVYPGTPLARLAAQHPEAIRTGAGGAPTNGGFAEPAYFLSPELGEAIFPLVARLAQTDPRFLFSDPTDAGRNYNYSGNNLLVEAIRRGHRGAYWDILRRVQDGLPPA